MTFIRDPWTAELLPGPNRWLGAVPGASEESLFRELYALAQAIKQAMNDCLTAALRGDTAYFNARKQDVANLRGIYLNTAAQYAATGGPVQTVGQEVGAWLQKSVPSAVAAIPNTLLEAIRQIGVKAGMVGFQLALPLVAVVLGGLWLVTRAERTRTYRRYVA